MPEYTFNCSACDHDFSKVERMDDRNLPLNAPCPNCGGIGTVHRTYSTGGWVDPGILKADKNMERSGVLKELNRMKEYHPEMKWKG